MKYLLKITEGIYTKIPRIETSFIAIALVLDDNKKKKKCHHGYCHNYSTVVMINIGRKQYL